MTRDELVELGVVELADRVIYLERRVERLEVEIALVKPQTSRAPVRPRETAPTGTDA